MAKFNINISQLSDSAREELAKSQEDSAVLEELAKDECLAVRLAIAVNKKTPRKTLENYAKRECINVCRKVAHNPSVTTEILITLAERFGNDQEIAMVVVQDRDMPTYALAKLITTGASTTERVNEKIVKHPSVDENILRQLAYNVWYNGNMCDLMLSMHPKTPQDALEKLAENPRSWKYIALAMNPRTPQSALEKLQEKAGETNERHLILAILETRKMFLNG